MRLKKERDRTSGQLASSAPLSILLTPWGALFAAPMRQAKRVSRYTLSGPPCGLITNYYRPVTEVRYNLSRVKSESCWIFAMPFQTASFPRRNSRSQCPPDRYVGPFIVACKLCQNLGI